jgi:putative transcriptional regulator
MNPSREMPLAEMADRPGARWSTVHDSELYNRIRVFRAEHRLSQADLARDIGVSRKTISTIELGRNVPSTVIALLLARRFEVPVEEIFSLDPDQ